MEDNEQQDPGQAPPPRGWSKAAKRRAAARRRSLPGGRGDGTDTPSVAGPPAPCGTCGLPGRCDCR